MTKCANCGHRIKKCGRGWTHFKSNTYSKRCQSIPKRNRDMPEGWKECGCTSPTPTKKVKK